MWPTQVDPIVDSRSSIGGGCDCQLQTTVTNSVNSGIAIIGLQDLYIIVMSSCFPIIPRWPFATEQPDKHEDRAGPAGQPLLHDGGAQLVEGAELKTPEAAQLHGGVFMTVNIVITFILCMQVSMKTRAAFGSMGSMKMDGSGSSDLLLGSSRSRTGRFCPPFRLFISTSCCSLLILPC